MGSHLKIGFFGGTFDPIHIGHLNLIVQIQEKCHLDQVLICPAHLSPTKKNRPVTADTFHRLEMVKLVANDLPWAKVLDIEVSRPPPSYTIESIQLLLKSGKGHQVHLILAEDTAYTIDQWKDAEKLLKLAPPLVGTRYGFDSSHFDQLSLNIKSQIKEGWIQISAMDISSTDLRRRLKNQLYCGHLIPAKVLDYIYENHLY